MHKANQLNVEFTRKSLTANVWQGASQFVAMIIIGCLVYAVLHPPVKYFATQDGRIIPLHPTNKPAYSDTDVIDFGNRVISEAFTLDFVNYRSQMNKLIPRFSDAGFQSYYTALTQSNILSAIKDKKNEYVINDIFWCSRQQRKSRKRSLCMETSIPIKIQTRWASQFLTRTKFCYFTINPTSRSPLEKRRIGS